MSLVARREQVRRLVGAAVLLATSAPPLGAQGDQPGADSSPSRFDWRMPAMPRPMPMLAGFRGAVPKTRAYLPGAGIDPATLPEVKPREVHRLEQGDTLALEAGLVRRTIMGKTVTMYGFNGQHPGPLIRVEQGTTIVVAFTNNIEQPTSVHWHGLRLDNRFDGVPGVTQDPVPPGGTFIYEVFFPDAGIYWYHPHHREELQQELGLYGNMLVESANPGYYNPVNREEVVILDDLLFDAEGILPFGEDVANHALMGRFGNVFLVNGEEAYDLAVKRGEVVRFYITNVSNTRTFNIVIPGARLKLVGADVGRFEREVPVQSVALAPAQRYIVEAYFPASGVFPIINQIQAIDHFLGEFYPAVDTLGTVTVSTETAEMDYVQLFNELRAYEDVTADIDRYRPHFNRAPDHRLELAVRVGDLHPITIELMASDTTFYPAVEWNDAMPVMNWLSTSHEVEWVLRDPDSGRENMNIDWRFSVGDVKKIRIFNDPESFHPMHHPIHLHGQRFLVIARNDRTVPNLVWKDTVIVPVGMTVDILVDVTNPGRWMMHCHIAEHLDAGMKAVFTVESAQGGP